MPGCGGSEVGCIAIRPGSKVLQIQIKNTSEPKPSISQEHAPSEYSSTPAAVNHVPLCEPLFYVPDLLWLRIGQTVRKGQLQFRTPFMPVTSCDFYMYSWVDCKNLTLYHHARSSVVMLHLRITCACPHLQ